MGAKIDGLLKAGCLALSTDSDEATGIGEGEEASGESGSDFRAISGCEYSGCGMMSKPGVIRTNWGSPATLSASS